MGACRRCTRNHETESKTQLESMDKSSAKMVLPSVCKSFNPAAPVGSLSLDKDATLDWEGCLHIRSGGCVLEYRVIGGTGTLKRAWMGQVVLSPFAVRNPGHRLLFSFPSTYKTTLSLPLLILLASSRYIPARWALSDGQQVTLLRGSNWQGPWTRLLQPRNLGTAASSDDQLPPRTQQGKPFRAACMLMLAEKVFKSLNEPARRPCSAYT